MKKSSCADGFPVELYQAFNELNQLSNSQKKKNKQKKGIQHVQTPSMRLVP